MVWLADVSIVSTANPWLDFMSPAEAVKSASELNADLDAYCRPPVDANLPIDSKPSRPTSFEPLTSNRLWGLGLLPLVEGVELKSVIRAIEDLKGMDRMKGVVMGTRGLGKGLDDPVGPSQGSRPLPDSILTTIFCFGRRWRRSGARSTRRISSPSCAFAYDCQPARAP